MIGQRLGSYEITAKLGEGGMGVVYKARDFHLGRDVALKVLPESLAQDQERLARFEREAKLLAQLNHPNIAQIYGFEASGETRALVMELVEGPTLADRLEAGAFSLDESLSVSLQIAHALEEAHEKGIVHRDLKPQNIKASSEGKVKVLDFGLAKAMDPIGTASGGAASGSRLAQSPTLTIGATVQGIILGTAAYMAPEQAKGFAIDKRADIWAFGVILCEMLTGAQLFGGDSVSDTIASVLRSEIDLEQLPAGAPAELRRLLRRCLDRNPKNRLHDIADARLVIEDLIAGRSDVEPAATPLVPTAAVRRRSPALAIMALVAALLAVLGAFALGRRSAPGGGAATRSGPALVRFEQVTDAAGLERQPSLSPDGKDVVFTRVADGRSEVMLQRVGSRVATSLTASSGVDDREPSFSPDGTRIAFRSERDGGGVFVMDISGESLRRISDFGFWPTWSPDGKEVAIASGDFLYPTDRGGSVRGLWGIDVASGAKREISRTGDAMQPRWSPHGQRIAFWGLHQNGGQRDVYTVASDGSDADAIGLAVTNDAPLDWSPEWSPDGRYLYFASNRGGTMNLWRVAIEESSGKTLGAPEPVTTPSLSAGGLSFSRDGRRLAFGSVDWRSTLFRAPLDAANGRLAGPPEPVLHGTQPIRDHQISPDGQWVAFNRVSPQEDLFVVRVDGTQSRRLTDDTFRDRSPAWSPDGQRIAFYSDRSGSYQLWLTRPDGGGMEKVTQETDGTVTLPIWSPDGKRIAYPAIPGGGRIVDVSSGRFPVKPEALPEIAPRQLFWPFSWSRDGKRLGGTNVSDTGVLGPITVYDLETKKYAEIRLGGGTGWRIPSWLSDSRRMVARDGRGIWLVDLEGNEPRRLVAVGGYAIGRSVGVSLDDRWLTWTETGTEGDVWIAELE